VVEGQPRGRHTADRERGDEARRAAGGRACEGRRPLGRGLRPAEQGDGADDLQAALDAEERARDFFSTLDSRNRYAILHRIQDAKKPETRARRIEKFVAMLREGEKLYP
jgi:hypothetical protein